jgi:hypothetical protein
MLQTSNRENLFSLCFENILEFIYQYGIEKIR